jgi:soluble P-type ATPase
VLNGVKVTVTPSGDNGHELDKNIVYIKDSDCDIVVAASRTKGSSVETLNIFAKAVGIKVDWIKKKYCNTAEMTQCNRKQAFDIFESIIK